MWFWLLQALVDPVKNDPWTVRDSNENSFSTQGLAVLGTGMMNFCIFVIFNKAVAWWFTYYTVILRYERVLEHWDLVGNTFKMSKQMTKHQVNHHPILCWCWYVAWDTSTYLISGHYLKSTPGCFDVVPAKVHFNFILVVPSSFCYFICIWRQHFLLKRNGEYSFVFVGNRFELRS